MRKIFLVLVSLCLVAPFGVQANPEKPDSTSYQYAMLIISEYGIRSRASVEVLYENGFVDNLTGMLEERVKQNPDRKARFDLLLTMEAIRHLDRHGYELVGTSSTLAQNAWITREYVFRKKRLALSVEQ